MWEEAGNYSQELSSARPVASFFSVRVRSNEKTDQNDCTCFLEGGGVGRIRYSESALRAF